MSNKIISERVRIGAIIQRLREDAGLSQVSLAEKAGLAQTTIARVELGKYSTGLDILCKIASALGRRVEIK